MHLSQETFDQIASLLQNDAKQFRRSKLTESITFKKTDLGYAITLDNMGIGKLSIKDNQFAFSSHSALGEVFNKTLFDSLEECQAAIVSHMMGDKTETEQLDEEADELEEAVKVSHDRYVRSTGKKATGSGNWMFTHKKMGDVNWKDEKDFFNAKGSLAAASKEAKEWAKKHGYSVVYVMEEVKELDETAYEKDMDPKKKVTVQGVKGMKSRPFKKTFRNEAAYDKWADSPAAEDVTVHRVYQEEVEEIDEANTTPFFYKDLKTKTPLKPADEIKALQDYIKRSRSESGSGSDQRLYMATQRLQYLSARVVKEETDCDEEDKKDKKSKKKDSEEMDMDPKAMKESFKDIFARLKEDHLGGGRDGYPIYHPTYSAAVQEALKWAQRKGFKVNEDDYFNKVSTGPRKPTPGKTVSHSLALDNNKKKMLHLQVYNTGNSFELNCYVS